MSKKILFAVLTCLAFSFAVTAFVNTDTIEAVSPKIEEVEIIDSEPVAKQDSFLALYDSLGLGTLNLNKQAYILAVKGFQKLDASNKLKKHNLLAIVDFSQPSTKKRLYIIDIANKKLLFNSLVAHGRNSGMLTANSFSNVAESNKSSLGFYVTSETYQGKHGLSLRLDGMEKNINDNARNRAIVIHGANYATDNFTKATGYLGRSFGCPALPFELSAKIISTIQNGTCLFLYSPDQSYLKQSTFVSKEA